MFRAVLDSNVYISALCFGRHSPPSLCLDLAVRRRFELWTSPAILLEVGSKLEVKFAWETAKAQDALRLIAGIASLARTKPSLHVVRADPDDNRVLECAAEADAHFVVTGDSHLLDLGVYTGTTMIPPAQFVALFRE